MFLIAGDLSALGGERRLRCCVDPDLVARDAEGKPFTVRYDEVNANWLRHALQRLTEAIPKVEGKVAAMKADTAIGLPCCRVIVAGKTNVVAAVALFVAARLAQLS